MKNEYYKIHEVHALTLVSFFIAVVVCSFVAGYMFTMHTADFTMSQAQAEAYCATGIKNTVRTIPSHLNHMF